LDDDGGAVGEDLGDGCTPSAAGLEDRYQFAVGRSTESITNTSIGAFAGSSFSPSCSWSAVKMDGPPESSVAAFATGT
jgi:hypothetical protein